MHGTLLASVFLLFALFAASVAPARIDPPNPLETARERRECYRSGVLFGVIAICLAFFAGKLA